MLKTVTVYSIFGNAQGLYQVKLLWFKVLSSRTSFQLEEKVLDTQFLDTTDLTFFHVQQALFCKAPCASPPGLISDKPMWEGWGGQPYLSHKWRGATPRDKGATGLQRKRWPPGCSGCT